MATRIPPKSLHTRERIFVAARTLFDKDGMPGVSMRRIADAVGVTPMAIYKHYADKDAVIDALMLDGFAAWEKRVARIKPAAPLAWLEALSQAFLDFALESPRRYEAAFLLPASRARRYPDDFAAGQSPAVNMIAARIKEAQRQGLIDATPPTDIVLTISGLGQGLVAMYHAGRFVNEARFRAAYRNAARHCLGSYQTQAATTQAAKAQTGKVKA
jgi:AcrR family transcriptional regulator